jgi:hypothetical protein
MGAALAADRRLGGPASSGLRGAFRHWRGASPHAPGGLDDAARACCLPRSPAWRSASCRRFIDWMDASQQWSAEIGARERPRLALADSIAGQPPTPGRIVFLGLLLIPASTSCCTSGPAPSGACRSGTAASRNSRRACSTLATPSRCRCGGSSASFGIGARPPAARRAVGYPKRIGYPAGARSRLELVLRADRPGQLAVARQVGRLQQADQSYLIYSFVTIIVLLVFLR